MLSESSLCIANKIAQRLEEHRVTIIPRTGTPIAMLSAGQASAVPPNLLPGQYLDVIRADAATYGAVGGADALHDEKMEWSVDLIVKGVSRDLDVAKNTIAPVIDKVLDDIEKDLCAAFSGKAHGYEIIQEDLPKFYGNQKIENLFERYKEIPIKPMAGLAVFPPLAGAEILRRISTGDDDVNKLLTDLINPDQLESLVEAYNYNFGENARRSLDFTYLQSDPTQLVILYFLTIGLEADMPEGVNASASIVINWLRNFRGLLGAVIYRSMRQIERKIESKELVREVLGVSGERKIYVNKAVYDKFLDEGGSPEAIFGTVCGKTSFTYGAMLDGANKLEKIWEGHLETIKSTNNLNKLGLTIVAIRKSISDIIDNMEAIPAESGGKGAMQNRLAIAARGFYLTDMENLPRAVKRLVFEIIFPAQVNARYILDAIDQQEVDGDGHKRLAASVVRSLIAEWLVKNVEVIKSNASI